MPDLEPKSTTVLLQSLLDRFVAGDQAARDELVSVAIERLMIIARKLLRSFGGEARVAMWTTDVVGEAYPKLARAMDDIKPSSPAQFFGLARLQMHRVLLDRVRMIDGSGEEPRPRAVPLLESSPPAERPSPAPTEMDSRQRDLVIDLLAAIEQLPENQATTTWLKLAGHTHREIAENLGVHHDTVDTYWSKACVKLAKKLAPFMETK